MASDKLFESASERFVGKVDFSSWIEPLEISPDRKRVAYRAVVGKDKQFVVVDGVEGKQYDGILKGTPIFSPDDPSSIRYLALLGSSIYMVEVRIK